MGQPLTGMRGQEDGLMQHECNAEATMMLESANNSSIYASVTKV